MLRPFVLYGFGSLSLPPLNFFQHAQVWNDDRQQHRDRLPVVGPAEHSNHLAAPVAVYGVTTFSIWWRFDHLLLPIHQVPALRLRERLEKRCVRMACIDPLPEIMMTERDVEKPLNAAALHHRAMGLEFSLAGTSPSPLKSCATACGSDRLRHLDLFQPSSPLPVRHKVPMMMAGASLNKSSGCAGMARQTLHRARDQSSTSAY